MNQKHRKSITNKRISTGGYLKTYFIPSALALCFSVTACSSGLDSLEPKETTEETSSESTATSENETNAGGTASTETGSSANETAADDDLPKFQILPSVTTTYSYKQLGSDTYTLITVKTDEYDEYGHLLREKETLNPEEYSEIYEEVYGHDYDSYYSGETMYYYDEAGNTILEISIGSGFSPGLNPTPGLNLYTYDESGNKLSKAKYWMNALAHTDAGPDYYYGEDLEKDSFEEYEYDSYGNLTKTIHYDHENLSTVDYYKVTEYNKKGEETHKGEYYADGTAKSEWIYDYEYVYDDAGNNIKTTTYANGTLNKEVERIYDEAGNPVDTFTYKNGTLTQETKREYDEAGNLLRTSTYKDGKLTKEIEREYDADGNQLRVSTYEDGILTAEIERTFNDDGKQIWGSSKEEGKPTESGEMEYDENGNLVHKNRYFDGILSEEIEYLPIEIQSWDDSVAEKGMEAGYVLTESELSELMSNGYTDEQLTLYNNYKEASDTLYKEFLEAKNEREAELEAKDFEWTFDEDTKTLRINGTGNMQNYYDPMFIADLRFRNDQRFLDYDTNPWYDYSDSIEHIVIDEGITSIGDYAFIGCNNLVDISIPEGVTIIGEGAFQRCGLESISIPDSVISIRDDAFESSGLRSVIIPEGMLSVGSSFSYCKQLTEVYLPASLKVILSTFYNCDALTDIYFAGSEDDLKTIKTTNRNPFEDFTIHYNVDYPSR